MSKIVSGSPRFQAPRLRKSTAFLSRVDGRTHMLRTRADLGSPPEPPGPEIPQDAIFFAPLENDLKDYVNNVDGTFSRNSDGTYENASGWQIAGPNVPRFGTNGLLMERTISTINYCINHNNAPGTSLANVNGNGATISAVSNPAALAAAGLTNLVPAGNVFEADNQTAGAVTVTINCLSANGTSTVSCWINTFGNNIDFGFDAGNQIVANSSSLVRFEVGDIASVNQDIAFVIPAGNKIEFILNQIERYTKSSPIITNGATSTRLKDELSWDLSGVLPSITEGMSSLYITNKFPQPSSQQQPGGTFNAPTLGVISTTNGVITLRHGTSVVNDHRVGIYSNDTAAIVPGSGYTDEDKQFRAISRWNPGTNKIQASQTNNADAWVDSTEPTGATITTDNIVRLFFDRASFSRGYYPYEFSKVALWADDKGLQWLKDNA